MPIDFIFIGPQKTGTTWVDACLRRHPSIQLPTRVKETHFFDEVYERGLTWYEGCFASRPSGVVRGEVAPSLFHHPEAPARVAANAPNARIWITLRHPVERARSHYHHHWSKGRIRCGFREALERHPDILDAGRYSLHIRRWLEAGFRDRCSFLFNEDMRTMPNQVWERMQQDLGLNPEPLPEEASRIIYGAKAPAHPQLAGCADRIAGFLRRRGWHGCLAGARRLKLNRIYQGGEEAPPLLEGDIAYLLKEYLDDVSCIEDLTGRRFDSWRRSP